MFLRRSLLLITAAFALALTVPLLGGGEASFAGPPPLSVSATCAVVSPPTAGKPFLCNAFISGGSSPFTITWDVGKDGSIEETGFDPVFTISAKGAYSIDVTVVDGNGDTASTNVTVIVQPQPLVLIASCGPATVGKTVGCDASATGGSTPYTFSWDLGKDGSADATGPKPSIGPFEAPGEQSVDVTVVDDNGATASVNLTLVVETQRPVVSPLPSEKAPWGVPIEFSAFAFDPDGADPTLLKYHWDFGVPDTDTDQALNQKVTFAYPVPGEYTVTLTVTDVKGSTTVVTTTATVNKRDTNIKYEGPISVSPNDPNEIELSAVLVDHQSDPVKGRELQFFLFAKAPGGPDAVNITDGNGRARVALPAPEQPGEYTMIVHFKGDDLYEDATFSKALIVLENGAPVVSPLADPGKHVWGVPIEFSGFATDPDGSPQDTLKYVWDFGDGTSAINQKVSHAYAKPGIYLVTLTVTDKDGASTSVSREITINKRPTAIKNCGDIQVPAGQRTVNDCARLIDSEGDRVVGRTVVFTMTIAGTPITNSGLTDANGELRTAFNRNMPAGCFSADIVFDGSADNLYESSEYDYFFYTSGNGGPQNCSFTAASSAGYDVNCDGSANSIDALYILQVVAGLTSFVSCQNVANVNGDGVIDPLDALTLLQHSAGLM